MCNTKCYENLANAIILQAVWDYRKALRKLANGRKNMAAEETKSGCERFFRSGWYKDLTSIDGEKLIKKLSGEAESV